MTFFPSAGEMRGILGPVVADAVAQLGSVADLYALAAVKNADNSISLNPALQASGVGIKLTEISDEEVQEIFGLNPTIVMKGKTTRAVTIELGMVFEVIDGDFAGRWLKVDGRKERPLNDSYVLGLSDTQPLT